ncbi:MAG: hypothetical protein K2J14_03890 [Treponemataceae bacterium]|nr:hypothetical protein [Treponemataceae bacterium]
MKKNEKLRWLMPVVALLALWGGVFLTSCSGDDGDGGSSETPPAETQTPLGNEFDFNGYKFEVVSGTAAKKSNGNIVITTPEEGIAIRLTKAATEALELSATTGFYVQAELLPTALGSGSNKNFGPAGLISDDSKKFSYAGVNYNGRNQLGEISTQSTDGKGAQFGSLISDNGYFKEKWTEPYIIRYEYKAGVISGYINGIQFNKSGTTTYPLKDDFSDYVSLAGIYTNGDSFEMSSFKIGAFEEGKAAIKISAMGDFVTLSEDADSYILLMNPSLTVRMGDDAITYTVKAFADDGTETEFTVESSANEIVGVEKTESGFTATPRQQGSAQVTVKAGDITRVFSYTVEPPLSFTDTDYGDNIALSPAAGAEGVFEDEHLEITFDDTPLLMDGGTIVIYEVGSKTPVDTIKIGTEGNTVGSANYTLKNFMVQVIDKTVFIKLHCSKLENGKKYVVGIPNGVITGTLGGKNFTGFDPRGENPYWTFTVREAYTPSSTTALTVANTGTADYRTVQAALEKAADGATITVNKGVYREILNYSGTASMTIVGETDTKFGTDVVIQGINCNSFNGSSDVRTAFLWKGADLTLKNITIQNAYDRNTMGGTAQSEALYFNSTGKLGA